MSVRFALFAIGAAAILSFSGGDAIAAPQVLGLVASNGMPTPLVCNGRECSAHFSTFCLQQNRPAPARGNAYAVAPGGALTLIAQTANGRTLRLPGNAQLRISSEIGFTSVAITLPQARLAQLGATAVAVEVGPKVSLLPVAAVGDPSPQSEDEVALATGPMRQIAAHTFEVPGTASDAARITTVLINGLPGDGPESAEVRAHLWVAALDNPALANATAGGLAAAQRIYEGCRISVESRSIYTMRKCLELRHADLLAETNHKFWKDSVGY